MRPTSSTAVRRALLAGNVVLPILAAAFWIDGAAGRPAAPAYDTSGAGLVLLTVVRGW